MNFDCVHDHEVDFRKRGPLHLSSAKRAGPTGVYIVGSVDVRVVDIRVGGLYM